MVDALLEQATWLTPTSLFLLLNVVIATILISSAFSNHPKPSPSSPPPPPQPPQLARAPSLFSRVTSFNFSNYYPDTTTTTDNNNNDDNDNEDSRSNVNLHRHYHSSPSFFTRIGSFNFSGRADGPGPDETEDREEDGRPDQAADDAGQGRAHVRMTRAGSFLSRVASFTYRGPRGPQSEPDETDAKENNDSSTSASNNNDNGKMVEKAKKKKTKKKAEKATETTTFRKKEEEVDAKADDFINKFKQQLKMQRIDSLMRYRSA